VESADRDNKRALARKVVIEERKEKAERAALAAEQEEADRRLLQQRINDSVEEQRRKDEMCVPQLWRHSSSMLNLQTCGPAVEPLHTCCCTCIYLRPSPPRPEHTSKPQDRCQVTFCAGTATTLHLVLLLEPCC
jgi:hypothetical protein